MPYEPDILVQSLAGFPIAIVEVKNRQRLTPGIASWMRREHIINGLSERVRFFLLISQDVGYLWDQTANSDADAPPTASFDMKEIARRYDTELQDDERIPSAQLEFIVFEWLRDLADKGHEPSREPETKLDQSGFLAAIEGGRIMFGATV
jgi:hypothetical protein